jgi:hypothetical protein
MQNFVNQPALALVGQFEGYRLQFEGCGLRLKGTGFSPYMNRGK